ncbi:MAG: SDR family NAD(P)-dependent oxidoreductase [Bacteroidota bacterium]
MKSINNKRVWLITGVSTGLGKELAKLVVNKNERVVATFRSKEQADHFTDLEQGKLGLVLDVTNNSQITTGIEKSIEESPTEEIHRQFDVNVFGAIEMIKAVLPQMRKQKSGHILNITSVGGIIGFTGSGIYNASKFALEGIGQSLQLQIEHLGIRVTNIEPGPFRTDWAGRSANYTESKIGDYTESVGKNLEWVQSIDGEQAGDPVKAAKAMYEVSLLETPPLKLPLGEYAYEAISSHYKASLNELMAYESIGRPTDY